MKGVSIGEPLCAYLKEYRRGQENATSNKELEAVFHVGGTELWQTVDRLRRDSRPVCSADAGYFYAARRPEVKATVVQFTGRISKIAAATKSLLQSYEEAEG